MPALRTMVLTNSLSFEPSANSIRRFLSTIVRMSGVGQGRISPAANNEMLTELRRELHREATTKLQKKALKGTRWLLLKRTDNLDERRREPQRLLQALKLNESLATAYYMKDDLNQFWEQPTTLAAIWFLNSWIADAQGSGITLLMKFAKTLAAHRTSLLAWYDHPISTGPLEGTNNKIKTLTRQAYGYRDFDFFRLKLFALHNSRYALLG